MCESFKWTILFTREQDISDVENDKRVYDERATRKQGEGNIMGGQEVQTQVFEIN